MDLRELGYFVAVFEERSVTAAARRCFVSQPSVSAAIASLEEELETRLFVRHRKGVSPTPSGQKLYPVARRLADETRALRSLFRRESGQRRVTVGLMRSLDMERTLAFLAPLTSDPDLQLRLVAADAPCDARVISKSLRAKNETFIPLWDERYVVALPPAHPLALGKTLRSADLAKVKLVERCHCEYGRRLTGSVRRLEVVARAESEEWALALVAAGIGVALVPEGIVRKEHHVVTRALSDVRVGRQVGLAYRAGRPRSADIQRLIGDQRRGAKAGGISAA